MYFILTCSISGTSNATLNMPTATLITVMIEEDEVGGNGDTQHMKMQFIKHLFCNRYIIHIQKFNIKTL
jgi:hypothetical protein